MTVENEKDLNLPAGAAALVLTADGGVQMYIPNEGSDEDEVADNALAIAAFGALIAKCPERVEALINEFMSGSMSEARH